MKRFAAHEPIHSAGRLTFVLAAASLLSAALPLRADVTQAGDKPGILKRLNPFSKKEEAPPAPPPPPPAPAKAERSKPATSGTPGPRPKVTTIKPKGSSGSKSSGSSKGTTAKKSSSAPKKSAAVAKKEPAKEPVKETTDEKPSAPKAEDKDKATAAKTEDKPLENVTDVTNTKVTGMSKKGDSEFEHGNDEEKPAISEKPGAPEKSAAPEKSVAKSPTPDKPIPRVAPSAPLPASQNAGWQIVKIDGRDYVTGESINNFYRFSSYKVEGTHVWLRSNNLILKAQIGSQEILINNIKFILSYPVTESGGRALFSRLDLCKLIDPVLRPTYITDAEPFDTVVVDAGHGGHDAGARGIYGYEKDFALKMAFAVKESLTRRGFKVLLTRSTDEFISLSGRVAIANRTPNSIFLSLHFNSGGPVASGIETFALTPQGSSASLERGGGYNAYGLTGNSHDSANIALATAVHAMVISKFKFVDRGIKRAQWSVLTGCKRPGILFEGGFVTNGGECRLIASDTYRQSVSTAIADAIGNYRTALRGAMTNRR